MNWRTEIGEINLPLQIDHSTSCLLLGSCFAENIGTKLKRGKFLSNTNPTGITYNPISLLKHLTLAVGQNDISEQELKQRDNTYVHLDFHSQFSDVNRSVCIDNIRSAVKRLSDQLETAAVIFISLGSCIVFKEKRTDSVVANCHKLTSSLFEKYLLSQQETDQSVAQIVAAIKQFNPSTAIVFTVSPVRHSRHGLQRDNRSKAQLISAVHKTIDAHTHCHYFPSYEIMKDDLRDYRFYTEDLIHPSQQAIEYIWTCFTISCMSSETRIKIKEIEKLMKQIEHRFLTTNKQDQISALEKLRALLIANKLKERFSTEIDDITSKLNTLDF